LLRGKYPPHLLSSIRSFFHVVRLLGTTHLFTPILSQ
jgi:hypothetical protein